MALRNVGRAALTAYVCSIASSLKYLATIFPDWITLAQDGALTQIAQGGSLEMSAQVMRSPKMYEMSNNEFVSAICRRSSVEDATNPKHALMISRENPELFYCACDRGTRPRVVDLAKFMANLKDSSMSKFVIN